MKLNLGCGNKKMEGYVNIDSVRDVNPDRLIDLEKGLKAFKGNSVDEIYTSHTLEHIQNFVFIMEEIHRVCKPHAIVRIIVPYYAHPVAFQDPTHVRFFTEKTFHYFDSSYAKKYPDFDYRFKCDFRIKSIKKKGDLMIFYRLLPFDVLKRAFNFLISELEVELEVIK